MRQADVGPGRLRVEDSLDLTESARAHSVVVAMTRYRFEKRFRRRSAS